MSNIRQGQRRIHLPLVQTMNIVSHIHSSHDIGKFNVRTMWFDTVMNILVNKNMIVTSNTDEASEIMALSRSCLTFKAHQELVWSLPLSLLLTMTSSKGKKIALLALCARNSPVTGEFPSQRPVKRSFDVFYDLRLNKRLSKQSWGWWFETPSRS